MYVKLSFARHFCKLYLIMLNTERCVEEELF